MVQREEPDVDLYVVGLPADFQPAPQEPGSIARVSRRRVLYITSNASGSMRRELFRAGAAGVLTHPVEKIDLQYRAEQVLSANWNRFRRDFDEPAMLKFLKEILDTRIEVIEPSLDPQMPTGHFYPAVAKILGRTAMDRECLEKLAAQLGSVATDLELTTHLLRFRVDGCRFSVFPGGRAILFGLDDPDRARVLYDRYVGA